MDDENNWFLMKHDDGSDFGPIALDQLREWAREAKVAPLDKVSNDGNTWVKAPMIPELEMDYLIEVSPDQYYGPTTMSAVKEFFIAGEIQTDSLVTNCRDGSQRPLNGYAGIVPPEEAEDVKPVRTTIRQSLQQRIRELEEALLDERRARESAEQRLERLESQQ